jgi:hypothetical protein
VRGKFWAYGEFETSGPGLPVLPVVVLVLAFAVVSALATILLWLAAILLVLLGFAVAVAVWMRRRYPDYSPSVAEQAAALHAEVTASKAKVVEHHHYIHPLPGATAGEASWAPLVRGTVEPERNEKWN